MKNIVLVTIGIAVLLLGVLVVFSSNDDGADSNDEPAQSVDETPASNGLGVPEAFVPDGDITELVIEDLTVGDGAEAATGDTVVVHYHGSLASDGTVFDSSYQRGEPVGLSLLQVIEGWQEGIPGMKVGGVRRLLIPSEMAYGEISPSPDIPANSDLVFQVELIEIQ